MQPALRDGCFVVDIELVLTLPALFTFPSSPLQNTFTPDIPVRGIGGPVFVNPMEAVQGFRSLANKARADSTKVIFDKAS